MINMLLEKVSDYPTEDKKKMRPTTNNILKHVHCLESTLAVHWK